jgi:predicted RNA-binding protein associated with RNAse of E/G family
VGRWLPSEGKNYNMPLGSFSWGVWWKEEDIGAYRLHDPHGNLISYRFDVLKDVRMIKIDSNDLIQFSDLVVDLWLWPDEEGKVSPGDVQVEDLEELENLKKAGSISLADSQLIDRVVKDVREQPQRFVDLVDRSILEAVRSAEKSFGSK